MIISGGYPILTMEDRNNLSIYNLSHTQKTRMKRQYLKRFAKLEFALYAMLIVFIIIGITFKDSINEMAICILSSIVAIEILSLYGKHKYKKECSSTNQFLNLKCIGKYNECEDTNILGYYKLKAEDTKTNYQTDVFVPPTIYTSIEEQDTFNLEIESCFLNSIPLVATDTFAERLLRVIC
ncbi:hypothetical protein CSX00_13085 [Pseudobutyrivibrio ruminis]|uniref:Uncharacterized protein n=1 Tax=Pseudobutyrivibrio ruminis TaxID=46206 RepID=A0A2G3E6S8_9FIRM|nr:hypothetical protein [Pseudobutyrivibrio ruminis]PHU39002.1 hypothetical protein CSX00_13085 [Pseudobutyrivibrio ruminis]